MNTPTVQVPFPRPETPTACRTSPALFTHEPGDTDRERTAKARKVCSVCPLAPTCLTWALANPDEVPTGIWAGTTALQRGILRARLANRLGTNWVTGLAALEQARRKRTAALRTDPLTVQQSRIVHLDREFNGPLPKRIRPLAPEQQAVNRQRLLAALTDKAA
ncbi:WhiB family transcriptional regulator [Streptomyces clavifer]|uniref:WhiB family transcriptional regulator n=1 Tax=Streptomyces clavifer TaxID=68188 RepID=UPI003690DC25